MKAPKKKGALFFLIKYKIIFVGVKFIYIFALVKTKFKTPFIMKILSKDFPITQTGKSFPASNFICPKIYDTQRKDIVAHKFKNGVECLVADGYAETDQEFEDLIKGIQSYIEDDNYVLITQGNKHIGKTIIVFLKNF